MSDLYRYKGCGLDNIYLANGFEVHETEYGTGVSISKIDKLHKAIGRSIVISEVRLRGQEVRFIRGQLEISQVALANLLGVKVLTVKRWEKKSNDYIGGPADRALRLFYGNELGGSTITKKVLKLFKEIDDLEHVVTSFKETDSGWDELKAA